MKLKLDKFKLKINRIYDRACFGVGLEGFGWQLTTFVIMTIMLQTLKILKTTALLIQTVCI